jgi:adenylate kinase family enzyme
VRVVIIGNSGSGKSMLARRLAEAADVPVLDLDTIAWEPGPEPVRSSDAGALARLRAFCDASPGWVVEGCYGELARAALAWRPELLFLDPGEAACLANCRARPWEPHKYASREAQDAALPSLLRWVSDYYRREGELSLAFHRALFDAYDGPKRFLAAPPR